MTECSRPKRQLTRLDDSEQASDRTCVHCGLPGHIRAECMHREQAQEQRDKVRKLRYGSAAAAIALAGGDYDGDRNAL